MTFKAGLCRCVENVSAQKDSAEKIAYKLTLIDAEPDHIAPFDYYQTPAVGSSNAQTSRNYVPLALMFDEQPLVYDPLQ